MRTSASRSAAGRLAVLGVTVGLALPVGLTAAPTADAKAYPAAAEKAYMSACVKSARGAGASKTKAKRYCKLTLKCLESKLTLKEFKAFGLAVQAGDTTPPHAKAVKACQKQANAKL